MDGNVALYTETPTEYPYTPLLPFKLSDCIEVALGDMEKHRLIGGTFDMLLWLEGPMSNPKACTVCAAGAVMLYTLGKTLYMDAGWHNDTRLRAINAVRAGQNCFWMADRGLISYDDACKLRCDPLWITPLDGNTGRGFDELIEGMTYRMNKLRSMGR